MRAVSAFWFDSRQKKLAMASLRRDNLANQLIKMLPSGEKQRARQTSHPIRHPHLRPARRLPHRRIRRHRPGPVRLHDAGRHGRRSRDARSRRREEEFEVGGGARPQGGRARPEGQGRGRAGARPARQRRCADRGLSSRRDGAAGPRTRCGAGAQSAAGVRPHDRLGPGRPAGAGRRPRHQLHLDHRRARRDRHQGEAGAAAQPRRRFRRRRALSRGRRARRRCWKRRNPARARWSMPRCATARPR